MTTTSGHVTKKYYLSVCIENQNLHRKELEWGSTFGSSKELVPWFSSSEDSECRTSGLGDDSPESRTCDLDSGFQELWHKPTPESACKLSFGFHLDQFYWDFLELHAYCPVDRTPFVPQQVHVDYHFRSLWGYASCKAKTQMTHSPVAVVSSIPACATREP